MGDEWDVLRKNVSQVLKKEISIEEIKHIVAIINVIQEARIKFKGLSIKEKLAYARGEVFEMMDYLTHQEIACQIEQIKEEMTEMTGNINYEVYNSSNRGSKKITFEITGHHL